VSACTALFLFRRFRVIDFDVFSTQDMYIFWAGAVFTFFCFYLIWRYLG